MPLRGVGLAVLWTLLSGCATNSAYYIDRGWSAYLYALPEAGTFGVESCSRLAAVGLLMNPDGAVVHFCRSAGWRDDAWGYIFSTGELAEFCTKIAGSAETVRGGGRESARNESDCRDVKVMDAA